MKWPVLSIAVAVVGCAFCLSMPAQDAPTHAPDGGTRETLISIDIPSLPNAPFTATVVTEWTRILPDGSTQTNWNHRTVARDTSGRVFQERRYFSPNGDKQVTPLSELDYQDPYRHELYLCKPAVRVCTVYTFDPPPVNGPAKQRTMRSGMGTITVEDLGRKTIENLDVVGSREITTINAGVVGNQKAEPTVKEFRYSTYLGINLITKRFDPHASAIQNFEVKDINLSEPSSKLFAPPQDYRTINLSAQ